MKQVVVIHGGHAYDTHEEFVRHISEKLVTGHSFKTHQGWKEYLQRDLGDDFEVFNPKMPNKDNAEYIVWKIWFERMIPFLNEEISLIGHSRGALFLIKYLSENIFPKKINNLILVAAPYTGKGSSRHEDNKNFFMPKSFDGMNKQTDRIFLFHSKDDPIVPFSDFEIYKEKLSITKYFILDNEGHFNGDSVPGLVELIK